MACFYLESFELLLYVAVCLFAGANFVYYCTLTRSPLFLLQRHPEPSSIPMPASGAIVLRIRRYITNQLALESIMAVIVSLILGSDRRVKLRASQSSQAGMSAHNHIIFAIRDVLAKTISGL